MGHVRNLHLAMWLPRYKKMKGFNVFHPMGWDAFGLPAENAAITEKKNPADWTYSNIKYMRGQLQVYGLVNRLGQRDSNMSSELLQARATIFIDMFKNGLAYKKLSEVNWDPVDKTVLANEQVIDGKGVEVRHALVKKKNLSRWFKNEQLF